MGYSHTSSRLDVGYPLSKSELVRFPFSVPIWETSTIQSVTVVPQTLGVQIRALASAIDRLEKAMSIVLKIDPNANCPLEFGYCNYYVYGSLLPPR